MEPPLLDRVSSAALARLAAARGERLELTPAGPEAVPQPRRRWLRALPALFLALSLASVAAMGFGVAALFEGGIGVADAAQLALMLLLVLSVLSQSRAVLARTPLGRLRRRRDAPPAAPPPPGQLDRVSAESLAARSPAVLPTAGRGGRVVRSGGRAAGRLAVICVLAIAALATVAMAVVLGWIVFSTGIDEPAAWLTAPFTALTGFASWQLFSSARASGFRGRPWALLSRGFRDSVRLWGSGSAISRVAMTTTATASVAGAAAAPAVLGPAARWDLFVVDTATAAVYRVDLDTLESTRLAGGSGEGRAVALGSTQKRLTLPDGRRISAGSLLVVVEGPNGAQRFLAVRPRATQPIVGSLIEPPLPGAHFAAGAGAAFGLQPDGSLWRIDPASGAAETITRLTIEPGPMSFEPSTGDLLVISGNRAFRVDAETGEVRGSTVAGPEGFSACGVARGRGDSLFLTQDGSNTILAVRTGSREARQLRLSGDVPLSPCQVAAVKR